MTRQVHELAEQQYGVRGHITSLNPIRPENAPGPWETEALQTFERGKTEVSSVEKMEGKEYIRLMRPLITEKGCLKCHAAQGYQEGDIRGGISVSVPMEPLWAIAQRNITTLAVGHILLWLIGLGWLILGTQRLRRSERERNRAEEELRETQKQLAHQEKLAVLGELAGGVAHEIRNPLGAIKNAGYLLNMAVEEPEPEVKETIEILQKEVETSERVVSNLLDFARPKLPTRCKLNINDVVQQALSRRPVPESVQVVSQLDETLPAVLADPDQLNRIFDNLILNAVQAMPEGGRLVVKSEASDSEWVTVTFADTGAGIDDEALGKIFEPLFTTKAKGIGLGLALTKMLVEAHGGTIEVESEVGKGTSFTVSLPICGEETE